MIDEFAARVRTAFHNLPQSRFLGLEILDDGLASGQATMLLPFSAGLASTDGSIDWVATATLIDTVASLAVCSEIEGCSAFATIDLAMQRLSPLRCLRPVVATAVVLAHENQVATVAVELRHRNESVLLGTARAGFWISDQPFALDERIVEQNPRVAAHANVDEMKEMEPIGLEVSGFGRQLKLRVRNRNQCRSVRLPFQRRVIFNPLTGVIHGGFIAALLEYTAIDRYRSRSSSLSWLPPATLGVDFLRPARAADLWAAVTLDEELSTGRTMTVETWQDNPSRPIASAMVTFTTDGRHLEC